MESLMSNKEYRAKMISSGEEVGQKQNLVKSDALCGINYSTITLVISFKTFFDKILLGCERGKNTFRAVMAYKNGSIQTGFQDIQVYTVDNDATLQRLPSFDPANRVTLSWHNINAFAKPKQRRCWNCKSDEEAEERKQILKDVNGEVQPGHLLAIMGASGAGKTTLLNTLTARNLRRLDVTGEVLVNDQNVGENMARVSAYVQQDDLFVGTLTVREHLVFQALLRMDKHLTYQERMKRVGEVILELGLSKCEDTIIGIAGRIKGISGGEAKRLAFAAEVLTNPSLMFCDEPTSGLDSFMSQSIISVLRNMAEGGRTIVCTIHQPSSEVFEMFDQLLLLAEGRVAYLGKASKATAFFERAGLRCPINYNPADFFIHNLAIVPGREDECKRKVQAICSQFTKEGLHINSTTSTGCSFTPGDVTYKSRYKASWCKQFRAVMWRSWISMIREPMLTKVRFFQTLIIALLLGLIYLRQDYDQKGIMNLNGALFLALTNVTFQNMFSVVNAFCLEQPIFLREHWNGMYRTDVYFICKTLAEAPILMMMTVMFITILYWMVGLNPDYKAFLISLAIFILIANTAASFGYMISCLANTLNIALSISTPLLMPLLLFGGFYLNNASVPDYFIWIKYISWFYYGNEALCINQWSSITNITCPENPLAPCMSTGETVIASLNFEKDYFERDIGLVVALFVFFRVLAFIALLIKSSRKT